MEQMETELPPNMTEEEVLGIVRELLGDEEMTYSELKAAFRSGSFQELCPDIVNYAKSKQVVETPVQSAETQNRESSDDDESLQPSRQKGHHQQNHKSSIKRELASSGSESQGESSSHQHQHRNEKDSKHIPSGSKRKMDHDPSISDDESSRHSHHKKKKKKKHKHHSKDNDNDRRRDKDKEFKREKSPKQKETKREKSPERTKKEEIKIKREKSPDQVREKDSKIRLEKSPDRIKEKKEAKRESSPDRDRAKEKESKREKSPEREKKKELKPFSKYNASVSHIRISRWRPVLNREHLRYQRKFRLKPLSVVCLDLLDMPMIFHDPHLKHSKSPMSIPLTNKNVDIPSSREDLIRRLERDKLDWFKKKLTRQASRLMKQKRGRMSSDEERRPQPHRSRIISKFPSSDSSASSDNMPTSKQKSGGGDKRKDRGDAKMSKAEREAEEKRKKMEEIKKKAEKLSARGTRVLEWEKKGEYFNKDKKSADATKEKEKAKARAEKLKRMEKIREERLQIEKNKPSVSFQRILAQIEAANKEEANKPKVQLKIPKKTQQRSGPDASGEYRIEGTISVCDVAKEVSKLLCSDVKVEAPIMPDISDDLGEYTVKKIAWWILKNEKDPPRQGVYHPELHDDDDKESIHSDDFDWPDDMSSIVGCVSDPEGIAADLAPDPEKVKDPDWADDYCGLAALHEGKIRRNLDDTAKIESSEGFKTFLRTKPGTNYDKSNFEAKCFICTGTEIIRGQRKLGAHIRSESHMNSFRNYSLNRATYEEALETPVPKKEFVAKLVEYSVNPNTNPSSQQKPDDVEDKKVRVGKIERVRSDSPGPIIAGDAAANIDVHEMPIPDDISLPSIEDYDISSDESLMQVRVAIRTRGQWDDDLEKRWRQWRDEEAKIAEGYNNEREFFINEPERHPCYQEEWMNFWDKRCAELEAEGVDTENYDFQKEWLPFWLKRMQEIMKERVEETVAALKRNLTIDKHTLRKKFAISAEETKRKKMKNKVGLDEAANSSSIKSLSKVGSSNVNVDNLKVIQQQQKLGTKQDQGQKFIKHLNHHDRREFKHNYYEKKDTVSESHNRGREHRKPSNFQERSGGASKTLNTSSVKKERNELENISSSNSNSDSKDALKHKEQKGNMKQNEKTDKKPMCSDVSSSPVISEPPPPGEEPLGSSSENKFRSKLIKQGDRSKKNTKVHKSSWSVNSDENEVLRSEAQGSVSRDSDKSSTYENAKALQSSLQALREALRSDSKSGSDRASTARPKIKPVENLSKKTLEDGEVASDISDGDFRLDERGVSSFINKDIPGLNTDGSKTTEKQLMNTLDKNSIGFHLLERRTSTDQTHNNTSEHSRSTTDDKRDLWRRNSNSNSHERAKHKHKHHKHNKDNKGNNYQYGSGSKADFHKNKRASEWQRRNNKNEDRPRNLHIFNTNKSSSNMYPAAPETEEDWETETQGNAWEPDGNQNSVSPVPAAGTSIPVLMASTRDSQKPYNPHTSTWSNSQHWESWDANYNPQMSNSNNYYS